VIKEVIDSALYQFPIQFDMRKFNFTNRIISVWNSLPDFVVSADTVDVFKTRLDRFWIDQEIRYIGKADICIGSRSHVNVILQLYRKLHTVYLRLYKPML